LIKVAGTKVVNFLLESLGTPRSQALSHWFNPMDLLRVQRKSALSRGAPVSVEFVSGEHGSSAAWPA
jgi:hypothetical protein